MEDDPEIPECFVEQPDSGGYWCSFCDCIIKLSSDNSKSRTIQKLRSHTNSKSHLSSVSNRKITPFLQSVLKPQFSNKRVSPVEIDLDEASSTEHGDTPGSPDIHLRSEEDPEPDSGCRTRDVSTQRGKADMVDSQTQVYKHAHDVGAQANTSVDDSYCQTEVESILAISMELLFETKVTSEIDLLRVKDCKFVCALIRNIIQRVTKHHKHDIFVKGMFARWAILGNVSSVSEIASFLGGPSKRTLAYACRPKVPVFDHLNEVNLDCHLEQFKLHLEHRISAGMVVSDVPCILSTDATATTGRVGVKKHGDTHYVMGLDHRFDEPITVQIEKNLEEPDSIRNDEVLHINGLETFPKLFDDEVIERANSMNAFILVPLIENCFTYNLTSFPVGKMFSGTDLHSAFEMVKKSAEKFGVHVKSMPGDGDSRLVYLQHHGSFSFTSAVQAELKNLEYPPLFYFNSDGDFPMQDICHAQKKLVNCLTYLDSRFLIMADSESVHDSTYTLHWGMILELAVVKEEFRDSVSLTTLQHSDKQNPACATELMACWSLVTKAGYLSLGAYLKMGHFLLASFYDKTLSVYERAENAWAAFTFFCLWKEHSAKYNESQHFITRQCYNDLLTSANGLILYFVNLMKYPKAPIVPWFLTSDHNEQLFARIRVGHYAGRRTQIDSMRVPAKMGSLNRLLEVENLLDVDCSTNVYHTAHTRGKDLFSPKWCRYPDKAIEVELGSSIKMRKLIQSLKKGSKIAEELFISCSHYEKSYLNVTEPPLQRKLTPELLITTGEEEYESESDDDDLAHGSDDSDSDNESSQVVEIRGIKMKTLSAITKYCNQGRTNFGAKSRRKRFFGTTHDTSVAPYRPACKTRGELCSGAVIEIGQAVTGMMASPKNSKRQRTVVDGKVLSMSVKATASSNYAADLKSGARKAATAVCVEHDKSGILWVKSRDGKIINVYVGCIEAD